MNGLISRLAVALNPVVAVLLILVGAIAGEYFASNSVGLAFGAITGLVVALPLCGGVSLLSTIEEQGRPRSAEMTHASRLADKPTAPMPANLNDLSGTRSAVPAVNGASAADASDGLSDAELSFSESEQDLLQHGEFGAYHLSKAKRFLDAGKYKDAIYQAGACLAHDKQNAEAISLRDEARAKRHS